MASAADQLACVNPGTVDKKDYLFSEKMCTENELKAVELALLRILQEENPLPPPQHELRKAELSRRLYDCADSENSDASVKDYVENELDSKDLLLLSKLLNQVHHFNMDKKRDDLPSRELTPADTPDFQKPHRPSKNPHLAPRGALSQSEKLVDNVVDVASAAADAAKAAAAAAAKNIEVMESLFENSNKLNVHNGKTNESCSSETSHDCSKASDIDERTKELVKRVEKQNRITHWILGIMMITTVVWRFKVLSMALGLKNAITNPFQAVGAFFDQFNGSNKEEPSASKPFQKARTVLPSLLQERGNNMSEKVEKATSEDPKVGEGLARSLDNILNGGKLSSNQSKGNSSSNQSEQ